MGEMEGASSRETPSREEIGLMYARYQRLQAEAESVAQQLEILKMSMGEIERAVMAIEEIEKGGTDVKMSVGAGAFVDAKITNTDKVMVTIGSGLSVEKDINDAKEFLKKRKDNITKAYEEGSKTLRELTQQLEELGRVLNQYLPK
jgi:prefoldin alpha subunit